MPEGGDREAYPDGRLQRRDDRARRALPADPRPGDLRRRPGRHRPRRRSGRTCRRSATWTERHYDFSGYVTGFDPSPLVERREELRRELGYHDDERVVIVTVGGSGVGESLLRRVIAAYPEARAADPGPADDRRRRARASTRSRSARRPASRSAASCRSCTSTWRVCDLAVVQGGLTTTMELTAARPAVPLLPAAEPLRAEPPRPAPAGALRRRPVHGLRDRRPGRDRGGDRRRDRRVPIDYRPVATDGARRAAELIASVV